jgi:Holliday junction resolvase-like predicted endonuclease
MSLNQNFDTLADALAALQRQSRWKIADAAEIDLDQKHLIEFKFRLDVAQLPRPLQIGTLGQSDWSISASINRPLVLEVIR